MAQRGINVARCFGRLVLPNSKFLNAILMNVRGRLMGPPTSSLPSFPLTPSPSLWVLQESCLCSDACNYFGERFSVGSIRGPAPSGHVHSFLFGCFFFPGLGTRLPPTLLQL